MPNDLVTRLLEDSIGKPVLVKLRGGRMIRGILLGFDQHMNLLLQNAAFVKKSDSGDVNQEDLSTIIIRGDNIVAISPP